MILLKKRKFMQSSELYFYNSVDLFHTTSNVYADLENKFNGVSLFSKMLKLQVANAFFHDRSNSIKTPVNSRSLDFLKLPEFKNISYTLEEACQKRCVELMNHSIRTNKKLVIMWSGGIDSTTILVSFLTSCSKEDIKNNIIVLLNDLSIEENPQFYHKHIKNVFNVDLSDKYPKYFYTKNYMVVTGEGNDQLFGSSLTPLYIYKYGNKSILSSDFKSNLIELYSEILSNKLGADKVSFYKDCEKIVHIQSIITDNAPIKIDAVYKFLWWINFVTRWQAVYIRLSCIKDVAINQVEYENNYFMFYSSEDIQLWIMNNTDKLISDRWSSYKLPCKEIILTFDKNYQYYREKVKIGSLSNLFTNKKNIFALDTNMKMYNSYPGDHFFNSNNTFSN